MASGAADNPPALAGAAHFYEHLVLRGGKRRGPGGGAREIEAVKGTLGAWTGLDETVYHAVVASPFVELGLDVLADAIANPNFDPGRGRAGAQAGARRDRGHRRRSAAAREPGAVRGGVRGRPHGQPVLGTAASVAALTPAALAAHFPETHGASGADRGRRR